MHKCQKSLPPLAKGQAPLLLTSVTEVYPDDAVWIRSQGAWWLAKEEVAITKFSSYIECLLNSHGYKPTAYCDDKVAWGYPHSPCKMVPNSIKTSACRFGILQHHGR